MEFRAFHNPNKSSVKPFDLIQYQRDASNLTTPQSLFQMWEDVCRKYESGAIAHHEWEEMKDTIWNYLAETSKLQRQIDSSFQPQSSAA